MGIARLNHAVLYVRNIDRSVAFYRDVLGFSVQMARPDRAAFLQAPDSSNDHDIGLFAMGDDAADSPAGRTSVGMYHLGWEVCTLDALEEAARALAQVGAFIGATDHGTSKSIYARDPDGLEFEIAWLVPADLLDEQAYAQRSRRGQPLDLAKEKARYGADTRGGIGVSLSAAVSGVSEHVSMRERCGQVGAESNITLTEEIVGRVNGALERRKPITVSYVGIDNRPHLSLRGSAHVHGVDQLAIWVRHGEGGIVEAIGANPAVGLLYRDSESRTTYVFSGRARVASDEATRSAVFDASPQAEREHDPGQRGVAVVIDLDEVTGGTVGGSQVSMTRGG